LLTASFPLPYRRSPRYPAPTIRLLQPAEGNVGLAFGLVIAAGLSTTIGSSFVFCSNYANTKALAAALGISAGVMLYVSFVEIFSIKATESFSEKYPEDGSKYATLCFFGGVIITYLLDAFVHKLGEWQRDATGADKADPVCVCHTDPADMLAGERAKWADAAAAVHVDEVDLEDKGGSAEAGEGAQSTSTDEMMEEGEAHTHNGDSEHNMRKRSPGSPKAGKNGGPTSAAKPPLPPAAKSMKRKDSELELLSTTHDVIDNIDTADKRHLKNMGLMTGLAIGLHNFPEGLATFVATLADAKLGMALAVAIAVHNIPEGICVAMPVYYATGSKWKGFWWSFVSGVSEPIGGLFGYLILYGNAMSEVAYGALFGVVGGMMVYISLKELLPTALKYDPHNTYVTNCMFVGMAVMALSLILFQL